MSISSVQRKIIAFCEAKNKQVVRVTGLKLYLKADFNDITDGTFTDKELAAFWKNLCFYTEDNVYTFAPGLQGDTCVWCYIHYNVIGHYLIRRQCRTCTYGKRNGVCLYNSNLNRYGKILHRAREKTPCSVHDMPASLADRLSHDWFKTTIQRIDSIS